MDSKAIQCWDDLEAFGFNRLTGEACAYGMRILTDMNEKGAAIWRAFIGLSHDAKLADNWNSKVNGELAIASAMIPYELFGQLAAFCLLCEGFPVVVVFENGGVYGYSQERWARWQEVCPERTGIKRTYNPIGGGQPVVGGRCVHAMSGRVE